MSVSKKLQKSKNSKNTKVSKTSSKQQEDIIKVALELKAIYQSLDDCLLENIEPKLKKQVSEIMNECKDKFKKIKPFIKQYDKIHMCKADNYINKNISANIADAMYIKCKEIGTKRFQISNELSDIINPDSKKLKRLDSEFQMLMNKYFKCTDTNCKDLKTKMKKINDDCFEYNKKHNIFKSCHKDPNYIKTKREYKACEKDNCSSSVDAERVKKIVKETKDISKKTQKLLNKLVIPTN